MKPYFETTDAVLKDIQSAKQGFSLRQEEHSKMKKKILSILLTLSLMLTLTPVTASWAAGDYEGKIIILHSNDVHGAIDGYQYIAGLKNEYEAEGADVIMVDAGDYSQGTPYVSSSKGVSAVTVMNEAGYDVATIGNHEFDYGYEQLNSNLRDAEFETVCATISNGVDYDAYTIIEEGGVKVAFVGVATPETKTKANPAFVKGLKFLTSTTDPTIYNKVQSEVDNAKGAGADIVIALSHLGVDAASAPYASYDLLDNVTGLDFVIDGHSHTVMDKGDNNEPIQSTGTEFENIGVIEIDKTSKEISENHLYQLKEEDADGNLVYKSGLPSDTDVAEISGRIISDIDEDYGKTFAKSKVNLNGARSLEKSGVLGNRDSETNLGDLITDAMLWTVLGSDNDIEDIDHVVAVENGGGIRAPINRGEISKKDVNTVLPFGNTISVVYVKGEKLIEALEASTFCTPGEIGGFPQVAGMKVSVDTREKYDANEETYPGSTYYGPKTINRVTIESVNGKPFNPGDTYAVVTNNFCAAGGDTYYAFASATRQFDTGIHLDEAVMAFIKEELNGVIGERYANPQGRLVIDPMPNVSLTATKLVYNGKAQKPGVIVKNHRGKIISTDNYTVKYSSGRKKAGKYSVTVTFKNKYSGSKKLSFTIVPKKVKIQSARVGRHKVTVKMKSRTLSSTGGNRYSIAYRRKGATKWNYKTTSSCKKVIRGLKKGKRYQIKVRAKKTVGKVTYYGAWSSIKTTAKIK